MINHVVRAKELLQSSHYIMDALALQGFSRPRHCLFLDHAGQAALAELAPAGANLIMRHVSDILCVVTSAMRHVSDITHNLSIKAANVNSLLVLDWQCWGKTMPAACMWNVWESTAVHAEAILNSMQKAALIPHFKS